ncbi:MAG: helix-turn-helix domain-containing protein [Bauldia sp.]|nr:helix-turn-helix domain-containing protein [Bauldia sp.]
MTRHVSSNRIRFGEVFLTEAELAERWRHSLRTLQRWRMNGKGPRSIRIGRRTVYRISDVEAFETGDEVEA